MESVISQISLIIPAVFVSICAVLVFVFGFKKPSPLPEFDKKLDLSESSTKRPKKDKSSQNGDVKKPKKAAPAPEKKKAVEQPKQEEKKKVKKTETVQPKLSAKAKRAEENALRKQEIKEFREMEQEVGGGGWNVVVSKKKPKTEDAPGTPAQEKPNKKKKDNAKDIKDRVNNELKNEESIKAAISEIKEEITQPQLTKKKRARQD